MTEQERVARYGSPKDEDAWMAKMKWDYYTDFPPVMKCRIFRRLVDAYSKKG